MTLELYINGILRRVWLYDDFQPGYGQLYHEARREYIEGKIQDLLQEGPVATLVYTAEHYEFIVVIKSRPKPAEEEITNLITE